MPKEFDNIRTGSCTIDGVRCEKWIDIDGKSIPLTKEVLNDLTEKYGANNWYDWSCQNWGTKWNACDPHINHNDIDFFAVSFETAWSPPIEWIKNIMKDFPGLHFILEYEEPGMGYGGKLCAQYEEIWEDANWDLGQASDCCEAEVFDIDDERYSLKEEDIHTTYGTDYQCSECGEEAETICMNAAEIKPAKIKANETNES